MLYDAEKNKKSEKNTTCTKYASKLFWTGLLCPYTALKQYKVSHVLNSIQCSNLRIFRWKSQDRKITGSVTGPVTAPITCPVSGQVTCPITGPVSTKELTFVVHSATL